MNRETKSTNTLEYKSLTSEPFLYKEMLEISKLIVEKKSKEDISCTTEPCETESLEAFYESIWNLYPIKKGKGQVSRTKKQVLQRIGYNQMKRCVERFVKDMESEHRDRKYWMHGSTFFNSGYVDYLDKNYMQSGIESIPPVEKPVDPEDEELVGDDW